MSHHAVLEPLHRSGFAIFIHGHDRKITVVANAQVRGMTVVHLVHFAPVLVRCERDDTADEAQLIADTLITNEAVMSEVMLNAENSNYREPSQGAEYER